MGVKITRLLRLKAKAAIRKPSWYFSVGPDAFHGCKYPKDPTATAQHTPTMVKYAGNILLCKFPN